MSETSAPDIAGITQRLDNVLLNLPNVTSFLSNHEDMKTFGAQGAIYSATYDNSASGYNNVEVVLKVIHVTEEFRQKKYFLRELTTWSTLQPHANILELYGFCTDSLGRLAMVSPRMRLGNLVRYLQEHPDAQRLALVLDIARGVHYLHTQDPPIVHGDLKADNILIRPNHHACLADFGLSRLLLEQPDQHLIASETEGNWRWMAPERIDPEGAGLTKTTALTPASDIYSFGGVVCQVYSGKVPYHQLLQTLSIGLAVYKGILPARPGQQEGEREVPDDLWALVQDCWKRDRSSRPTADHLVQSIQALLDSH